MFCGTSDSEFNNITYPLLILLMLQPGRSCPHRTAKIVEFMW